MHTRTQRELLDWSSLQVVERMDLGALHDILLYNNSLVSEHASRLMVLLQVTRGLVHLHESDPPILHCNLKAANVFVDHMLVAKVRGRAAKRLCVLISKEQLLLVASGVVLDPGNLIFCAVIRTSPVWVMRQTPGKFEGPRAHLNSHHLE